MPDSPRSKRWWATLGAIGALSVVVVVLSVFGAILRVQLNDARTRLTAVEVKDAAEDAAARTAEVATCYASARGRPAIAVILRVVAGIASDEADRRIVSAAIAQYAASAPTVAECDRLARRNGLDPASFPEPRDGSS